ncbi:FAD dependent oxidoreductase-like protein [Calycina marina]|uniref:FAD dependent oxidoreductase-like protein n=1 Tax=Calycina marina TaxID=1763456 RepID=A0A9P7YXF4_9HELO|nr:FAD dependent oxidoreductase-like protein [Calycina marina]
MVSQKRSSGQSCLPSPKSTNSFWHREPSEFLTGHHTTPSLPTSADIIIIGSGIAGASAAYHLSKHHDGTKPNIVMLDAREACWGATGRNGGHCRPGLYTSPPDVAAFELRNYTAIKSLIEDNSIACEWKTLPGCHAYMSAAMFAIAVSAVNTLQESAPDLASTVKVITASSQNPSLTDLRVPHAAGAIVLKHSASLWPYKLVAWALEKLIKEGRLNLQTKTPATILQKVDDGWIVHTSPCGMIAAPTVLLCTNAYTSALLPWFEDLIVPVKGEMSALKPPAAMRPASDVHASLDHSYVFRGHGRSTIEQDDYLVQRPFGAFPTQMDGSGGELMFGGGRNVAPSAGVGISDDSSIDPPAAEYLRRELNVVLDLQNDDQELEASYEWSGIMGFSRDGNPWIGEAVEPGTKNTGLWVCAGFTGHGMPNTWLSGAAAADLILGRPASEVDLPGSYLMSEERVVEARKLDEVWLADSKALRDA